MALNAMNPKYLTKFCKGALGVFRLTFNAQQVITGSAFPSCSCKVSDELQARDWGFVGLC